MRVLLMTMLVAGCGGSGGGTTGPAKVAMCTTAACGGDLGGTWTATQYCDQPSGSCTPTASGTLTFNADKSYTASLQIQCPGGTSDILYDGKGTWSTSADQLTLTSSSGSSFSEPYCVVGNTLVVAQPGSSLYALWARPTR